MKKLMFNDRYGLTRAVIEGRKTMTRRVCKDYATGNIIYGDLVESWLYYPDEGLAEFVMKDGSTMVAKAPYRVGEVVAVAQAYKDIFHPLDWVNREIYENEKGWSNKMFIRADLMTHQIQFTDVRIERLQAITNDDVYKEGFTREDISNNWGNAAWHWEAVLVYYDRLGRTRTIQDRDPREAFAAIIDRPGVGRKGLWEENPFVFGYEFKLVR